MPFVVHLPLRSSRDDVFFRQCKMNGIGFDTAQKLGTLFLLADAVVGGVLSVLCMGSTRIRAIETAIDTLAFVLGNFGRQKLDSDQSRMWVDLGTVLARIRQAMRREKARDKLQASRQIEARSDNNNSKDG